MKVIGKGVLLAPQLDGVLSIDTANGSNRHIGSGSACLGPTIHMGAFEFRALGELALEFAVPECVVPTLVAESSVVVAGGLLAEVEWMSRCSS